MTSVHHLLLSTAIGRNYDVNGASDLAVHLQDHAPPLPGGHLVQRLRVPTATTARPTSPASTPCSGSRAGPRPTSTATTSTPPTGFGLTYQFAHPAHRVGDRRQPGLRSPTTTTPFMRRTRTASSFYLLRGAPVRNGLADPDLAHGRLPLRLRRLLQRQQRFDTHFLLAGVDLRFSPRLRATVKAGAEFRTYVDLSAAMKPRRMPRPRFPTTVASDDAIFVARYGIEEGDLSRTRPSPTRCDWASTSTSSSRSGSASTAGSTSPIRSTRPRAHRTALRLYAPTNFNEDTYDVSAGARYAINRHFAVEIGYTHTTVSRR